MELPWLSEFVAAKAAKRLPVVLTTSEVRAMLSEMNGTTWLVAALIYVTGMRLLEALRLREKDVEFERREIIVRQGKGNKDRVTMLPENLVTPLKDQLAKAKRLHDKDLEAGFGEVFLPDAFARKSKGAARAWGWQYVFPSPVRSMDPRSERERRHHIYEESIQRAVRASH
ncbi:MAG: tyrosine-type recombinase/integrase [Burkholderiales bacterium]